MCDEKVIRYEKPELLKYGFFGVASVVVGESPIVPGGDIGEGCDTEFDD